MAKILGARGPDWAVSVADAVVADAVVAAYAGGWAWEGAATAIIATAPPSISKPAAPLRRAKFARSPLTTPVMMTHPVSPITTISLPL